MRLHLGNPLLYSTHRATLMVMVLDMAAPRPLYVTSPPTAATIRRTMQLHGQTSTRGGGGGRGPRSTRAMLAVSAPLPHLYISALPPVPRDSVLSSLSRFPLHQQSASSCHKTTVTISFSISFCQGVPSHSLYLPPPTTLYPHSSCCTEYISNISTLFGVTATVIILTSRNTFVIHTT